MTMITQRFGEEGHDRRGFGGALTKLTSLGKGECHESRLMLMTLKELPSQSAGVNDTMTF